MPARKKHKPSFRTPGSLRKSRGARPGKTRRISRRKNELHGLFRRSGLVRDYASTAGKLFSLAGLPSIYNLIGQKMSSKKSCRVFVIAPFKDRAVLHIAKRMGPRFGNAFEITGMDLARPDPEDALQKTKHYVFGDALKKRFPKSDVIYSTFSLAYIGNIGFLVKKAANALNQDGIAVLHVNTRGEIPRGPKKGQFGNLLKDPAKLRRNLILLQMPNCDIRIEEGHSEEMPGFIVVLNKHGPEYDGEFKKELSDRRSRYHGPWTSDID